MVAAKRVPFRISSAFLAVVMVAGAFLVIPTSVPVAEATSDPAVAPGIPDEAAIDSEGNVRIVVSNPAVADEVAEANDGVEVSESPSNEPFAVLEVPVEQAREVAQEAVDEGAAYVEYDVPAQLHRASITPTDPNYQYSAPLTGMGFPLAWGDGLGHSFPKNRPVRLAVIDSGLHGPAVGNDFSNRIFRSKSWVDNDPLRDGTQHGTAVSVIAAGGMSNGTFSSGTCPSCQLLVAKVVADGEQGGFLSDIASAIRWAVDNGSDVINISMGSSNTIQALTDAVAYAESKGVVIVASAGNSGTTALNYPAAYPQVIAVGGYDFPSLARNRDSNYGSWVSTFAPMCNVGVDNFYAFCGTSSASPVVAGAVALMLSHEAKTTPSVVRSRIVTHSPTIGTVKALDASSLVRSARAYFSPFQDVFGSRYYAHATGWGASRGIVTGVNGSSTFAPTRLVTRAEAITMLWRRAGKPTNSPSSGMVDVPRGAYFEQAANWAKAKGIIAPLPGNQFQPSSQVSRGVFIVLQWRIANKPTSTAQIPYTDILPSSSRYPAIRWAFEQGIASPSSRFDGNRSITRAEAMTFMWRRAGLPTP